ncbi:hypothetical protein, partial [Enterocloster asparagiformis]|uniref:hypothetical protein n=1 Tax=Enterocloster asparagiformis TaxID=333367 RepID=UPI002A840C85
SGKAALETFSALVSRDTFRPASFPPDQLEALNKSMSEAVNAAEVALRNKENHPALRDYLRGDSPNPLPESRDRKPLEVRSAVRSRDLIAEERQSDGTRPRPNRETKSPETAPRETKERESGDRGFSR